VPIAGRNIPDYWIRPTPRLSAAPGLHRFVWDLHYGPPAVTTFEYPIAAVAGNTPKSPRGLWVNPGTYQVRLTVGGRAFRQAVVVKMDPRVKMTQTDLALQFRLSKSINDTMRQLIDARAEAKRRRDATSGDEAARWQGLDAALSKAYDPLPALYSVLQDADARPTTTTEAAVAEALRLAAEAIAAAKQP